MASRAQSLKGRVGARVAAVATALVGAAGVSACRSFPPPPHGFSSATFAQIAADPVLRAFALEQGAAIYASECKLCHGASLEGRPGFPTLRDATWIWGGGEPESIAELVRYGVRQPGAAKGEWAAGTAHGPGQTAPAAMPAFEGALSDEQIAAVAEFTERLIATTAVPEAGDPLLVSRGADVYAFACAACHGPRGEGQPRFGFVRLAGANSQIEARAADDLEDVIRDGMEARVMEPLADKLNEDEIRCVALFVAEVAAGRARAAGE
ncbi:MAG: c-type cytochrome [Planctomycetes bacterium]|nr:c-type cytochrome [Planctomycetota bacterium]